MLNNQVGQNQLGPENEKPKLYQDHPPVLSVVIPPIKPIQKNQSEISYGNLVRDVMILILRLMIKNQKTLEEITELRTISYVFWKNINEDSELQLSWLNVAKESPRFSPELKAHLNSARVFALVKNKILTVNQIIKQLELAEKLQNKLASNANGVNPSFSYPYSQFVTLKPELILQAFQLGCLIPELRFNWLSPMHIAALTQGLSFENIQGLSEKQVAALMIKDLRLNRADVAGINFTDKHLELLKTKRYNLKTIIGLTDTKMSGLEVGFCLEDVNQEWFSIEHVHMVNSGVYSVDEVRGLNFLEVISLVAGLPPEISKSFKVSQNQHNNHNFYSVFQYLAKVGGIPEGDLLTIYRMRQEQIQKLEENISIDDIKKTSIRNIEMNRNRSGYYFDRLLELGYSEPEIDSLSYHQLQSGTHGLLTKEQILNPKFSDVAAELAIIHGYSFDEMINFPLHQLQALLYASDSSKLKMSITQFEKFTPIHVFAFSACGFSYEKLVNLSGIEVLELLKEPKNFLITRLSAVNAELAGQAKDPTVQNVVEIQESGTPAKSTALLLSPRGQQVEQFPSQRTNIENTQDIRKTFNNSSN